MRQMKPLSDDEIAARLQDLQGWERKENAIQRTFSFEDFEGSMVFVNRVAELAEAADHHPDIDIRYSRVTLTLSTHDAGGLTERDFSLAEKIGA
jgi:4a-hydroxytetrahydrobiopterin dehydratase